jgi:nitrogenase molybdenum-iron protein beta chain
MGDDVEGVVHALKEEIPAEVFSLSTGGYEGPAWMGYEETLAELTRFMGPCEKENGNDSVNLIGFKEDDVNAYADLVEIKRMLNSQGIMVNTVLTNSSFEEIKNAPKAALNIVLGGDGLESAKLMQQKFDIPYVVVPYPFGLNNSIEFLEGVTKGLNKELNQEFIAKEKERIKERIEKIFLFLQGIYDTSVAVIGDSARAFDLAKFLSDELCFNVNVLAITSKNHISLEEAKINGHCETVLIEPDRVEMNDEIKTKGVELIFGSTMEKRLAWELGAPLVRIFYPVMDEVTISDTPYAGFRGAPQNKIGSLNVKWAKMWESGVLNSWSQRWIAKYGSISEAWNHMSVEYDKDIESSNRVRFIDKIKRQNPETILDVGAGTGVFAIPLAKHAKRVIAVEPSTGMLKILKDKALEHNLTNIECINKKWEEVSSDELIELNNGKYDLVICSHALYYITELHGSFKKMNDLSKGYVYLLIEAAWDNTDAYAKLWERLHKKPMLTYPDYAYIYMTLRELDIHPNIEMLDTYAKRYVTSTDEVIERWKDYLDLDSELTEDQRAAIREYLADKIKEEDGKLYMEWQSKDAVIHWKAE